MTANHRPLEEGDIELIDRVRATPCLYDTKDPNFRLVHRKEQEWQSVADGLGMSHWEARKRWTVLRDRYARELKQLILHPDSMEYGKNDFFRRMDFIRNFVKKREVKRKQCNSQSAECKNEDKPSPLKLYKVHFYAGHYESDDISQQENSYVVDYSQDSSSGKFSYVEQISQDPVDHREKHEHVNNTDLQCSDQDYNDCVEDTSNTYDDSNNYMLTSPIGSSGKTAIKPENTEMVDKFFISTAGDEKLPTVSELQSKSIISNICTNSVPPNHPVDAEEYFSKTIASYLKQLSPRYKIKAKVEMMQIIEKFIELEESKS